MPDHFYTTDPEGELAPYIGYSDEGIPGYVFTESQSATVPIYRFFNGSTGDHFYCRDSTGEMALQLGYQSEGVAWYMYADERPNTTALYRWWGNNDHFYTTDSAGEMASQLGYSPEGILGYLLTSEMNGAKALHRWHKAQRYELDGTKLKAWCYRQKTGEWRESILDLKYCLAIDGGNLIAEDAPDDLTNPTSARIHRWNVDALIQDGCLALRLTDNTPTIHARYVHKKNLLPDEVSDLYFNMEAWLQRSKDGHIEFVHPAPDHTYDWLEDAVEVASQIAAAFSEKDLMEDALNALLAIFQDHIADEKPEKDVAAWMRDTYPRPNGQLVRRGT